MIAFSQSPGSCFLSALQIGYIKGVRLRESLPPVANLVLHEIVIFYSIPLLSRNNHHWIWSTITSNWTSSRRAALLRVCTSGACLSALDGAWSQVSRNRLSSGTSAQVCTAAAGRPSPSSSFSSRAMTRETIFAAARLSQTPSFLRHEVRSDRARRRMVGSRHLVPVR